MRAIVTGGAGFIGTHLIEALLARGDDVVCLERPGAARGPLAGLPVAFRDAGLDDAATLRAELTGADVIYHLAALTQARQPGEYYQVNTEGTARLLQAALGGGGAAPRVVFMSSLAAGGPCRNGEALTPDAVPFPLSHYGHSKLLAESVLHAYSDRIPTVILRFPTVYGPRERAVLKLFRLVRRRIALTIGSWDRENSLIYVRDVVRALLAAAVASRAVGRTYCVAHATPVTWREFAVTVGRALGRRPVLLSVPRCVAQTIAVGAEAIAAARGTVAILNRDRVREMSQQRWVCDASRAAVELGISPETGIERGIAETAAWYEEAAWL